MNIKKLLNKNLLTAEERKKAKATGQKLAQITIILLLLIGVIFVNSLEFQNMIQFQ